jgi:hypothetical protein
MRITIRNTDAGRLAAPRVFDIVNTTKSAFASGLAHLWRHDGATVNNGD